MKQNILIIVVMFVIATFFIIDNKNNMKNDSSNEKEKIVSKIEQDNNSEVRAMYFSYIELEKYIKGKDEAIAKKNIDQVINNMKENNFNWLILHVRPFSDSIYPSKIFPNSKKVTDDELPFDILDYFINKAHENDIEVHAWINPYRISNQTDFVIDKNHPAYAFIDTNKIKKIEGKGIYYNPASDEVIDLIVSGVKEIVSNYKVDGIHFDDYFFPGGDIDSENYLAYQKNGGEMTLSEYRLNNTTKMISKVYETIKSINKDVDFGIAPEGNINNNYNSNFLDIKKYLSEEGYIDYVMPQIYFGFLNQNRPFIETIKEWNDLIKVDSISLIPALSLYKSGNDDKYAGSGNKEWIENSDIIKKQIVYARSVPKYSGFAIFRYAFFYDENVQNANMQKEVTNIVDILKK